MILLLGAGGQLGQECLRSANRSGVAMKGLTRAELDITNPSALVSALDEMRPSYVVNAGAYTNVDKAESNSEEAFLANAKGPAILAEVCEYRKLPLLHFSTDYVFDGQKRRPYDEGDQTAPINVYGASKLAGEKAITAINTRYIILRTSWVYGAFGSNFLKTMLGLARERDELRVIADQYGAPTSTAALAMAVLHLTRLMMRAPADSPLWGIYHFTGASETSWYGFANEIMKTLAPYLKKNPPHVIAIPTSDYPTPAKRPVNSLLNNEKFFNAFGFRAPDWRSDMRQALSELIMKG